MKIIKTYTEQTTGEKLYSTILSGEGMNISCSQRWRTKIIWMTKETESVKHAKASGALIGGTVGAGIGALTYGDGKLIDKKKKKDNEDK